MEAQIVTMNIETKEVFSVFGYATRSVPGLEINGLGKYGKAIKEKIIFITRQKSLQIPLMRFIINIEAEEMDHTTASMLEYPILLTYWKLAGLIKADLGNCLAVGALTPSGMVCIPSNKVLNEISVKYHIELINGMELVNNFTSLTFRQDMDK